MINLTLPEGFTLIAKPLSFESLMKYGEDFGAIDWSVRAVIADMWPSFPVENW